MKLTAKYAKHANCWTGTESCPIPDGVRVFRVVRGSLSDTRGLLGRTHGYSSGSWSTHNSYHADGNGNVTYLVSSAQTLAARYRYDPYGNLISSTETLAHLGTPNTYRFSSKEININSGLYYYGYRFYDPNLQRWLNRDPINEVGHQLIRQNSRQFVEPEETNLYRFAGNEPILKWDAFALLVLPGRPTTEEGCDAQYDARMKDVRKAGAKCLQGALKHGIVLTVVLGGGGMVVGASKGGAAGAGIGLIVGTGAAAVIDLCSYSHCMSKVNKMKNDAKKERDDCMERVQ